MEQLYEAQKELLAQIQGLKAKYDARDEDSKDRYAVEVFLERLEVYFDKFKNQHEKVLKHKNMKLSDDYFINKIATRAEDEYYEAKIAFGKILKTIPSDESSDVLNVSNQSSTLMAHTQSHLPDIHIPVFSGSQVDWENFRDLYRSVIHQNETLNNIQKFYYLKSYLRGKALEIVKGYEISANNYLIVWEALTAYYENKRRLTNKYVHDLLSVKPVKNATSSAMNTLLKTVIDPLDSLAKIGRPAELIKDDIAVYLIASNFDSETRMDWQKELGDSVQPPSLQQIRKFVRKRIAILESYELSPKTTPSGPLPITKRIPSSDNKKSQSAHTTSEDAPFDTCSFCAENHRMYLCPSFRAIDVNKRREFVSQNQLCDKCFRKHLVKDCPSRYTCRYCHRKHSALLHINKPKDQQKSEPQQSSVEKPTLDRGNAKAQGENCNEQPSCSHNAVKYSHSVSRSAGVLLATALIRVKGSNGLEVQTRALIDPCSQVSLISESLCQRLQLKPRRVQVPLKGTGGSVVATMRKTAEVTIKPHFSSSYSQKIETFVISRVSSYVPPPMITSRMLPHLEGLVLADPQFMDHSHIDVLLSASVHADIVEGTIIKGQKNEPIATKSRLGWYLSGDTPSMKNQFAHVTSLHICNDVDLDQTLQKFWLQEEVPKALMITPDEQEFVSHFEQTHFRSDEGRYVLRLPFKKTVSRNEINFTSSYHTSEKMLQKMEARFQNDSKLEEMYHNFLTEYELMDHMTNVAFDTSLQRNFIPHHGIWKEKSTSTKLRTVFNGSSKLKSGLSLNDLLHVGPNLLPILTDIIMGWQNFRYVFVADIEKMYRQILIHPDDRPYQCILWRYNPSESIAAYELNTVTYGLASSPCQANLTIKQLAKDHMIDHPWGASVLHDEIYMDDVLSGGHTVHEAQLKQRDCTEILLKGGFPLRKYQSNNNAILEGIPSEFLAVNAKSFQNFEMQFSILGLAWNPCEDVFYFNVLQFENSPKLTKRVILSRTAKLFDPLGWLAPIIINAKILMQLLWQEKKGWDEEISSDHKKFWVKWEAELSKINNIRIPRWNNYSPNADIIELHGFADASKLAYGACLYLRIMHENKHPLLLHHIDDFTRMLIRQTHLDTFHGGTQLALGTLRLQYWILKGRIAVKSILKGCHKCRLYSKRSCTQLMGNLPLNRTLPSKPFSISGIDYAGPIKVRLAKVRGNVTQKGYIAIFVCFSTHVIHIEIVEDYSSAAFIAAFHRFTSRRGQCSELHSDQGTTLVGADSELTKMFQGAVAWSEKVRTQLSNNGTRWHFNHPGAPHFGGLWESAVKSMKYHVYRMIGDQTLTFIEYSTLFCRIEAILNSRPLLPLSDDISDVDPLTPAHFLIQRSSYLIPEPDRRNEKIPLSKRWELLTQITQHFWDRWSTEYLTSVQTRTKWTQAQESIQVGDVVRIKSETTFPGKWPLGIVKEVHPGIDGLVRTATIRTADTELKRPIVKLVLLERVCNNVQ